MLEATRRGVVDGIACRVPTVSVRPGRPNSALSSFVSGIVREPLRRTGERLPRAPRHAAVGRLAGDTTANLAHAGRMPAATLGGVRTINLPGICVTPAQMLDSLERAAGPSCARLVRLEPDSASPQSSGLAWRLRASRALRLGFSMIAMRTRSWRSSSPTRRVLGARRVGLSASGSRQATAAAASFRCTAQPALASRRGRGREPSTFERSADNLEQGVDGSGMTPTEAFSVEAFGHLNGLPQPSVALPAGRRRYPPEINSASASSP